MNGLLLAVVAGLLLIAWWQASMRAREEAARAVEAACREAGVQWLDGHVVSSGLELARDADGRRCLRRRYLFDYCEDGETRRQGFVSICGGDLEWVGFGPTAVGARQ